MVGRELQLPPFWRAVQFGQRHDARVVHQYAQTRSLLDDAVAQLLTTGVATGDIRSDVVADDVLIGLSGIGLAAGDPSQRQQAERLVDLMIDGLRYRP